MKVSGEITNLEQRLIEAEVIKAEVIAQAIGELNMPEVMFISGGGAAGSEAGSSDMLTNNLMNLKLLESLDMLDNAKIKSSINAKRVNKK